ncbi:hypothetical protein L2E82_31701 [Cichorium intybus]|uniref:Uncharacterized protein n=1 Tax=Cichorium intybus TaxID=13427 RepID=A0ACB9BEC2_CICIN|nr:hypothetical protein L2E82_31701 [Cichorium intybus]
MASSSPLVTATVSSFRPASLNYQQYYTRSLISTNASKSEPKPCRFALRSFSVETSRFSPSENIPKLNRCVVARSNLKFPLISPDDHWGTWTALFATGAFGLWSERTKIGRMISAALVSILVGLAASNMGIIPHEARAYSIVMEFILPLTIPLMLFRADMRNVIKSTGKLLLAFLIGSVATTVGTLVAFLIVPMRSLGQDNWKIASALMASYIGGAINYVAVSDALGISPSVVAAGVAADNVICAIYFMVLFAFAYKIPSEASPSTDDPTPNLDLGSGDNVPTIQTATALAVSFAICKVATRIIQMLKLQGGTLPAITAIVVILATLLPKQIGYLAPAGDAIAAISIQVFFGVLGASGSIWNVIMVAPSVFVFAFIQVTVHLVVILGLGKLLSLDLKLLLLASNANIGGPTTASGMATAKGWGSLVVPGILVGIFGISIATCLAYFFGTFVLKSILAFM